MKRINFMILLIFMVLMLPMVHATEVAYDTDDGSCGFTVVEDAFQVSDQLISSETAMELRSTRQSENTIHNYEIKNVNVLDVPGYDYNKEVQCVSRADLDVRQIATAYTNSEDATDLYSGYLLNYDVERVSKGEMQWRETA